MVSVGLSLCRLIFSTTQDRCYCISSLKSFQKQCDRKRQPSCLRTRTSVNNTFSDVISHRHVVPCTSILDHQCCQLEQSDSTFSEKDPAMTAKSARVKLQVLHANERSISFHLDKHTGLAFNISYTFNTIDTVDSYMQQCFGGSC